VQVQDQCVKLEQNPATYPDNPALTAISKINGAMDLCIQSVSLEKPKKRRESKILTATQNHRIHTIMELTEHPKSAQLQLEFPSRQQEHATRQTQRKKKCHSIHRQETSSAN
jgi:hypothetical protein